MARVSVIACVIFSGALLGCDSLHYSVTPYAKMGQVEGYGGKDWQAGLSVTFHDAGPGTPAAPSSTVIRQSISNFIQQDMESVHEHYKKHGHYKKECKDE